MELLKINEAYKNVDGLFSILKFVHKISTGIKKLVVAVQNCFASCGVFSIIEFFSSSYQNDAKFTFW